MSLRDGRNMSDVLRNLVYMSLLIDEINPVLEAFRLANIQHLQIHYIIRVVKHRS